MNILLDAYFDHNFGDDLFISTLTHRYRQHRFYSFIGNCPESVQRWTNTIPNLVVLPKCPVIQQSGVFDAYIMIGGDVIPDGGDYTGSYERRLGYMRSVKATGGYIAMVGFSLYEHYSQRTYEDICEMLRLADDVIVRDIYSFNYLRTICEDKKIRLGADMAFVLEKPAKKLLQDIDPILGISVRKKLTCSEAEEEAYQQLVAKAADAFLAENPSGYVHFLALSYGSTDDSQESEEIIEKMKYRDHTKVVAYAGQIGMFIKEFEKCTAFITTRFHAMVIALLLRKPFVPIPYEVKVDHVLDQIGYTGFKISYGKEILEIDKMLNSLKQLEYDENNLLEYEQRANSLFEGIDSWITTPNSASYITSPIPAFCPERVLLQELKLEKDKQLADSCFNFEMEIAKLQSGTEEQVNTLLSQVSQQEERYMALVAESDQSTLQYENKYSALAIENNKIILREKDTLNLLLKEKEAQDKLLKEMVVLEQNLKNKEQEELALEKKWMSELFSKEENISSLDQTNKDLMEIVSQNIEISKSINSEIKDALKSRVYRLAYLVHRWKQQGLSHCKAERKAFKYWIKKRVLHKTSSDDIESIYNPFRKIQLLLNNINQITPTKELFYQEKNEIKLFESQKRILGSKYDKSDIIILSVIDYDFRHQRPQHFAERFAHNGHRVFYVNANFHRAENTIVVENNLYMINLHYNGAGAIYTTDFLNDYNGMELIFNDFLNTYCVRDAVVIVDYPNWINAALYLRRTYGFKFITDYMDDFTGFLGTTGKVLCRNCKIMLASCDLVIASSQFLYDIASQFNEYCTIIRNATEFLHFSSCSKDESTYDKKVIGYYGAVAHWFDYEKVCYLAKRFPNYDITIVGAITDWQKELEAYSNILLLGEKDYKELPEYLKQFDVCLIPFDTSTDLIKATNPVKFYEYLSAGKKIVATEIPELMPYRDKYLYMSNDNDTFGNYVEACLNGMDTLLPKEKLILFGKENDWEQRYQSFYSAVLSVVPKVSVIVITYNNLLYNKACLQSILEKTAYANYEVILVDNFSTDGTRDWLEEVEKSYDSRVKVIFNDENLGFAGGNNTGIRQSEGEYIVLLNNDTLVSRGWLTNIVKHMENEDTIGMVGAVTNSIGNEAMIKACYTNIQEFEWFSQTYTEEHMGERFEKVEMLAMFCTCIRRSVINKCGLLDEQYGRGMFEDDDYSEAVKRNGFKIIVAEDVFIHHFQSLSFSKLMSESYKELFEKNKKLYEKKWNFTWRAQNLREGITAETNVDVRIDLK